MIQLSIITPERTVYDATVEQITLQTTAGEVTILPNHVPYIAELRPGELRLVRGGKEEPMAVAGGFVEVLPPEMKDGSVQEQKRATVTRVAVLADDALRIEEMDVSAIEAARERARKALTETRHVDDSAFAAAAAALEREMARVRVARKYKKRRSEIGSRIAEDAR